MKPPRRFLAWNSPSVVGAVLGAALGLLFGFSPLGGWLANYSYDFAYLFRPTTAVDGAVMVFMDDASYQDVELHQDRGREWDRSLHAQLITRLAAGQARGVVFDILFASPGTNDTPFLQAIENASRSNTAVVVAATLQRTDRRLLKPFPDLQRVAAWGLAEHQVEDQIMRWHYRNPEAPSVAWKTAQLTIPNFGQHPANSASRRWINYYGPPRKGPRSFSYRDVLQGRVPASAFSNQVVFVGSSVEVGYALGRIPDTWPTPYSHWGRGKAPGVEINATVYLNLLHQDWLRRISESEEFLLLAMLGAVFGAGFAWCRPMLAAGLALAAMLGLVAVSCGLVWGRLIWFSWLVPVAVQVPAAALWSALCYTRRLGAEKELLEQKIAMLEPALEMAGARVASEAVTKAGSSPAGGPGREAGGPGVSAVAADVAPPGAPPVTDHTLLRCVGKGAYGEVWVARNAVGLLHAIKVVYRVGFSSQEPFEREFRGIQKFMPLSRLHPGLVQILQVGRQDAAGYFYYVMEPADDEATGVDVNPATYVPKTLAREIERRKKLPAAECLQLGLTLASALEFLHAHQLIHRDIKPANIIFVRGAPKLADIGLVTDIAATGTDATYLGTQGYIAPEGPGRPAADIYSLGRVLYQAAMGLEVGQFPQLPETLLRRGDRDLALELNQIIIKACEDDLAQRYATATELRIDLEKLPPR